MKKIKELFYQLKCKYYFHSWIYDAKTAYKCNRTCTHCDKSEHSMYQMAGHTGWSHGKHW